MSTFPVSAMELTKAFSTGELSAHAIASTTLVRIDARNPDLNAFVEVTRERMLAEATRLDRARARGEALAPLAAVPYAVKNLFDVQGLTTIAGAKVLARRPAAQTDATLVQRMRHGGALLAGTLNMDALAYGFTTENTHYGATHNPRDLTRSAGGSSGGSAAAVAAGLVPIALGSDTNGSIRVPASLCGVFGLKPTYGRLPRTGSFPFVDSLDHLGPFAANAQDLALAYDVLQGPDPSDPACAQKAVAPTLAQLHLGVGKLRVARLTGYFDAHADATAQIVARRAAQALGASDELELEGADAARAAAFVITAAEGGALHLEALRQYAEEFEPLSRERLIAGALVPAAWIHHAQRYRRLFLQRALALFEHYDLLIAPATPVSAPLLGQAEIQIGALSLPTRPNLGLLTQPLSFIGLPIAVAPLWFEGSGGSLPLGVQLIAAPWREDLCLRAARALEEQGVASSQITARPS